MTCEEARTAIAAGEDPVHECAACASWRVARDQLAAALGSRPDASPPPGFEGRLLERAAERPRPRGWRSLAGVTVAVAAVGIWLGVTRYHGRAGSASAARPATATVAPAADAPPLDDADRSLARTIATYDDVEGNLSVSADWAKATSPLAGVEKLTVKVQEGALR
jgi:hypothetical protein